MASVTSADEARAAWILTPPNTGNELEAWLAAYEASVGPPPAGSVPLPVRAA
jgi:hypothetical protein